MLTPNTPASRLRHVFKTYTGTRNEYILYDVATISLYLLGRDSDGQRFISLYLLGRDASHLDTHLHWLTKVVPKHHDADFLIPWIARELGRLYKEVRRGHADQYDYNNAVSALLSKAPAIAMWAKQESVDLNKTTLAEALEAIEGFDTGGEEVEQGDVVYEFDDGWTIQRLDADMVEDEGEVMQHCVGDYGPQVEGYESFIFSLRDPAGRPHVTAEWNPDWAKFSSDPAGAQMREEMISGVGRHATVRDFRLSAGAAPSGVGIEFVVEDDGDIEDDLEALYARAAEPAMRPMSELGSFSQIMGKQNDPPVAKYRPYIQQWIIDRFQADPAALLMVYTPNLGQLSMRGRAVNNVDFVTVAHDLEEVNVTLSDAVDFAGGVYRGCLWAELYSVSFADASFGGRCSFIGPMVGCDFSSCEFVGPTRLRGAFSRCNLERAFVDGAEIRATFGNCAMTGATFFACSMYKTQFNACDMRDVRFDRMKAMVDVEFAGGSYVGMEMADLPHGSLGGVIGRAADLDDVTFDHQLDRDRFFRAFKRVGS